MKRLLLTIALVLCAAPAYAQDKPVSPKAEAPKPEEAKPVPTLSEVSRLSLLGLDKDMQIAQLKLEAAQSAYAKALAELKTLVASLQVAGFDLDLQTLTYTPKPPEEPAKDSGKPKGGGTP